MTLFERFTSYVSLTYTLCITKFLFKRLLVSSSHSIFSFFWGFQLETQKTKSISLSAMAVDGEQSHQSHRSRQSVPTAQKKSKSDEKKKGVSQENNKQHNPKVLIFFNFKF